MLKKNIKDIIIHFSLYIRPKMDQKQTDLHKKKN